MKRVFNPFFLCTLKKCSEQGVSQEKMHVKIKKKNYCFLLYMSVLAFVLSGLRKITIIMRFLYSGLSLMINWLATVVKVNSNSKFEKD